MGVRFNWRDKDVESQVEENLKDALGELGLMAETEAKRELYPGHGVETGTLRRSIHAAEPGYDWRGDNVAPSSGAPERGGRRVRGAKRGDRIVVEVGSGMEYAVYVHQGHRSFGGYHYLTNAVEKVKPRVPEVLAKYKVEQ